VFVVAGRRMRQVRHTRDGLVERGQRVVVAPICLVALLFQASQRVFEALVNHRQSCVEPRYRPRGEDDLTQRNTGDAERAEKAALRAFASARLRRALRSSSEIRMQTVEISRGACIRSLA